MIRRSARATVKSTDESVTSTSSITSAASNARKIQLKREWKTPAPTPKTVVPSDPPVSPKYEDNTKLEVVSSLKVNITVNKKQEADNVVIKRETDNAAIKLETDDVEIKDEMLDGDEQQETNNVDIVNVKQETDNVDIVQEPAKKHVDVVNKVLGKDTVDVEGKVTEKDRIGVVGKVPEKEGDDVEGKLRGYSDANMTFEEIEKDFVVGDVDSEEDKDCLDVVEDEEVLKIIGNFELDLDEIEELEEVDCSKNLVDISEEEDNAILREELDPDTISEKPQTSQHSHNRKTISFNETEQKKEIKGLVNHGPYSRILLVGDSRLQELEKMWPSWHYIKPQILVEPKLKIEGIKDLILSRTELPHLENGTLLMCSVGLYDIITFSDYEISDTCTNKIHTPMKVMDLSLKATEDVIKLVMMRIKKVNSILENMLDSSSVVCFTAIIPCDPLLFYEMAAKNHKPRDHTHMSSHMKHNLNILKDKIQIICERVNKHLSKMSPLPTLWNIMTSYHQDRKIIGPVFIDGVNITEATAFQLSIRLRKFFQELWYGFEMKGNTIEFNHDQEVIVVGDSRLEEVRKMWNGDTPNFICEADMGFYNFTEFIEKNLVGLKNKIVLVCLGMNDLIKFVDDDEFSCENHDPVKKAISLCGKYQEDPKSYITKVLKNMSNSFKTFVKGSSSLMCFATVYPLHLDTYLNHQLKLHKENTGHSVSSPKCNPSCDKDLMNTLNALNRNILDISSQLIVPVWDMHHVVCRGNKSETESKSVLKDGIYPSEQTAEDLVRSYHHFVNEKFGQESKEELANYKFRYRQLPKNRRYDYMKSVSKPSTESLNVAIMHKEEATSSKRNNPASEVESTNKNQESGNSSMPSSKHPKNSGSSPSRKIKRFSKSPGRDGYHRQTRSPNRRTSRFSTPEQVHEQGHSSSSLRPHDFRVSRSPERIHGQKPSRSPERYRRPDASRSFGRYKSDISRRVSISPERSSSLKRSIPEREDWSGKYSRHHREHVPPRFQEYNESRSQYRSYVKETPIALFMDSMSFIRRECHKEKDSVIREGLLDLCEAHGRECELYLKKPDAYPDYNKEYRIFVLKKKSFFDEIGGDPSAFDYIAAWDSYWPKRMFELFEQSWLVKKNQYLRMMRDRKRRSSSPSSSSSSGSYKRKRQSKKKSSKHRRDSTSESKRRDVYDNVGRKTLSSKPSERVDEPSFMKNKESRDELQAVERLSAESLITGMAQRNASSEKAKTKSLKIVEVFGVLAYMKDRLGPVGMLVSVLYENALGLEKKGQDPTVLLEDKVTKSLMGLINKKLVDLIEEEDVSTIQKAIYSEAQSLLQDLVRNVENCKNKGRELIGVDVAQLAVLSMGKSIHETIKIIESFLLYAGYTDVPRERIEAIYLAVKDEQLKLNISLTQQQRGEMAVDKQPQPSNLRSKTFSTKSELTEEFFIGEEAYAKPKNSLSSVNQESFNMEMKSKASTSYAPQSSSSYSRITSNASSLHKAAAMPSTSRSESFSKYDEEFFTGRKFLKPNLGDDFEDKDNNFRAELEAVGSTYVPRKHIVPPPPPVISGMHIPVAPFELDVDYDALKKVLSNINM